MPFVLKKTYSTEPFEVLFDPNQMDKPPADDIDPEKLETLTYELRTFNGHDNRKFSNSMVVTEKGGRQRVAVGTVSAAKIMRAVVSIDGMVDEESGEEVTKMSEAVYSLHPDWILNRLRTRINEMNGESEDEEEFEGN